MLLSGIFRWEVGKRPRCPTLVPNCRSSGGHAFSITLTLTLSSDKPREMAAHGYLNPMISSSVEVYVMWISDGQMTYLSTESKTTATLNAHSRALL